MPTSGKHATQNRAVLEDLFERNVIDLLWCDLFDRPPDSLSRDADFAKIEGMMLGLAVGDALGNTSESLLPSERNGRYGEICDYRPNRHAGDLCVGLPSDDSQLAYWTLEQLLVDNGLIPENMAARFASGQIFGIGRTVKRFLANFKSGVPCMECGVARASNGALMRIAPILIPHVRQPTASLWIDTALAAAMTHNDAASTAACLAFVSMLWQLLAMRSTPPRQWWLESYVDVAKQLEGDTHYRPRGGWYMEYEGPIWRFVAEKVEAAWEDQCSVLDACSRWHSGAYLIETLPSVIYILMRHGHDAREAIVRAVNDTRDNDTVAAIVGAAVGALHGKAALPAQWIEKLSGRTTDRDDKRVFELLACARQRWG